MTVKEMITKETTHEHQHPSRPVPAVDLSAVNQASTEYLTLGSSKAAELEEVFLRGVTPNLDQLVGWEFRGMNQPFWTKLAGIKKFVKGFERRDGNQVYGYNSPVVQNALDEPWITKPKSKPAKRFGYYQVARVDPGSRDNTYLHAVLLDYGKGQNPRFDPSKGLRDYLVQVTSNNPDIFLGKAYYAIGQMRVSTNFFVLERFRQANGG